MRRRPVTLDAGPMIELTYLWSNRNGNCETRREDPNTMTCRRRDAQVEAEVTAFLPMAIDAYRLVPDLDADGRFHLSLLEQASGDYLTGLETAETVLEDQSDHLLALYAAGEAARELSAHRA